MTFQCFDGSIWFGYDNFGALDKNGKYLTRYVADSIGVKDYEKSYLLNDGSIFFEKADTSYLYTVDGLIKLPPTPVLPAKIVFRGQDESIWLGTFYGLYKLNGDIWQDFTAEIGTNVYSFLQISPETILYGTEGFGLYRYFRGTFKNFSKMDGLPVSSIYSMTKAGDRTIWMDTDTGLLQLTPDMIPPNTTFNSKPPKVCGTPTPFFEISGKDYRTKDSNLLFSYALSSKNSPETPLLWSEFSQEDQIVLPVMSNGTYTLSARCMNFWTTIDPTPATWTFTVDINPPTTILDFPAQNDTIMQDIAVRGYAFDDSPIKDFKNYSLFYGKQNSQGRVAHWDTLISQQKEIRNDTLALWNTTGLHGAYQLKLIAVDTLGHSSETGVSVYIIDAASDISSRFGGTISDSAKIELYFPPNSFTKDVPVKINRVSDLSVTDNSNNKFSFTGLAYDLLPDNRIPEKTGTLSIYIPAEHSIDIKKQEKLAICRYDTLQKSWNLIGGSLDPKQKKITVPIKKLGRYGLFEVFEHPGLAALSNIDIQPRVFSPQGGGYSTETHISFTIGTSTETTVQIFNMAGRLVRTICEGLLLNTGANSLAWDGRDNLSDFCSSGIYIVTVQAKNFQVSKTVAIINGR